MTSYEQGFIDKCAQHNVDPNSLIKRAGLIDGTLHALLGLPVVLGVAGIADMLQDDRENNPDDLYAWGDRINNRRLFNTDDNYAITPSTNGLSYTKDEARLGPAAFARDPHRFSSHPEKEERSWLSKLISMNEDPNLQTRDYYERGNI